MQIQGPRHRFLARPFWRDYVVAYLMIGVGAVLTSPGTQVPKAIGAVILICGAIILIWAISRSIGLAIQRRSRRRRLNSGDAPAISNFEAMIAYPAPGFACFAAGDDLEVEAYIAPIEHKMNPPADDNELKLIPEVSGADDAREFYRLNNGGLLFSGRGLLFSADGQLEGLEFFPLSQWSARTLESVKSWVETGYHDREMPYGRNDFLSIAHLHGAWTYIHWVVRGPKAGKFYWWPTTMPPAVDDLATADSFADLLDTICIDPAFFLNTIMMCYTRYSDGKTDNQWIAKRYIPDRTSPMGER